MSLIDELISKYQERLCKVEEELKEVKEQLDKTRGEFNLVSKAQEQAESAANFKKYILIPLEEELDELQEQYKELTAEAQALRELVHYLEIQRSL